MTSSKDDPWTAQAYQATSSFVPLLTATLVSWLSPEPTDRILDLGCGDGILTAKLKPQCAYIYAIDASPNLISAAKKGYGHVKGIDWDVVDCRYLDALTSQQKGKYDKVFSNAALHWILCDPVTRQSVITNTHALLKPNGTFVFEMGGASNVAEVHGALISALVHAGVPIEKAREACPWFFPSEALMRQMLEREGFVIEKAEVQYRPTKMTEGEGGGLEGWVRLHGNNFLEALEGWAGKREAVVREVCMVLDSVLKREEDGSLWIGYVRLRMVARKKEEGV